MSYRILGAGIDIIEVARVQKQVEGTAGFCQRVFSPVEIAYCESKRHAAQHYAARFAAKEAFFKALGTGWRDGMEWREVSVENNELGRPSLVLSGKAKEVAAAAGATRLHVSLSHLKEMACATVIIETEQTT
ncbi:MAG: holo-ACP synthase [Candidatus Cloacimonetes bacterium]|nr:holo-ACP synthase [Candidatus Cloacimonadota bacterium]